jgi:hypothetical protein
MPRSIHPWTREATMMTDPASPGADILGGTLVDMVRSPARADPDGVPYMFAADGEAWNTPRLS